MQVVKEENLPGGELSEVGEDEAASLTWNLLEASTVPRSRQVAEVWRSGVAQARRRVAVVMASILLFYCN